MLNHTFVKCPFTGKTIKDFCIDDYVCPHGMHKTLSAPKTSDIPYTDPAKSGIDNKNIKIQQTPEPLTETDVVNYFKICEQCIESTYDDLHAGEITEWSKVVSGWISKIGNAINDKTKSLRCKKCGCFCQSKSKYGSILQRISLGKINGKCPVKWDDGKTNWEHNEPLNHK